MEVGKGYSTVGSYSPKDKTFNNKGYYLTMEVKITSIVYNTKGKIREERLTKEFITYLHDIYLSNL